MNEIITFGQDYDLNSGIRVFIQSAKKFCKPLTVIGANLTPKLLKYLKDNDVNYIDSLELAEKYNVQANLSPYTLKMIYFYLYCKNISKATNVYLCDFTDLYFQANPFKLIKNNKPYVTSENSYIKDCKVNITWLDICYNRDILGMLAKREILNGGNIFGNKNSVTSLLKDICTEISGIISRVGNYQNVDQAALNKVVYFDFYNYNIINDFSIFNLAHYSTSSYKQLDKIYYVDNKAPYVFHQYDAIKELEQELYKQVND